MTVFDTELKLMNHVKPVTTHLVINVVLLHNKKCEFYD